MLPEKDGFSLAEDIRKTDFSIYRKRIDILTGGFPCQPYSLAGKRKGTEDDRHLWPRMLEVIREIQPRWVVGENVDGIINWDRGMVFEQIQADLEAEGYEVQPIILPAASVGAPHKRDRVWFIANNPGTNERMRTNRNRQEESKERKRFSQSEFRAYCRNDGDANSERFQRRDIQREPGKTRINFIEPGAQGDKSNTWDDFPTQSPLCGRNDGISAGLDLAPIYKGKAKRKKADPFNKWREESIKAYGNAIVPQVALEIFKVIQEMEDNYK